MQESDIRNTIKNISLDLIPGVAEFVVCVAGLVCKGAVLDRCNNIDKNIVLRSQKSS